MRNDGGNKNHWIAIKARGKRKQLLWCGRQSSRHNRNQNTMKEIGNAGSYLSSSDLRLYFGLGMKESSKTRNHLAERKKQILTDLKGDRMLFSKRPMQRGN